MNEQKFKEKDDFSYIQNNKNIWRKFQILFNVYINIKRIKIMKEIWETPRLTTVGFQTPKNLPRLNMNNLMLQLPCVKENKYIFYCPCFLRIWIDNFTQVKIQDLTAKVRILIKFDLDVTGLPDCIATQIKSRMKLKFHRQESQDLNQPEKQRKKENKETGDEKRLIGYRKMLFVTASMIPDIRLTPFQILNLILTVQVPHVEIWDQDKQIQFQREIRKGLSPHENEFIETERRKIFQQKLQKKLKKQERNQIPEHDRKKLFKKYAKPQVIIIKFNLMDFPQEIRYRDKETRQIVKATTTVGFTAEAVFGNYDLAQKKLKVQYTNADKCSLILDQSNTRNQNMCNWFHEEKQHISQETRRIIKRNIRKDKQKINPFRYAHFQIPLYRIPIISLLTTSLPIWILGWVSLAIFFQDFGLADRIASIATVMVAYTSYLTVVREEIPPTPNITFIQVLIYTSIIINIFCLIESVSLRNTDNEFQVTGFFLIAFMFQILFMFIVVGLILSYYMVWKPSYNIKSGVDFLLNPFEWSNKECNKYFEQKMAINDEINMRLMKYPSPHRHP